MDIVKKEISRQGIKFSMQEDGIEIGRAYLYILKNDLHEQPFGFMEDVFIEKDYRGSGKGKLLVEEIIKTAKVKGCYKLIGTSRYERDKVHKFYGQLGFLDYGKEFRLNF